MKLRATTELTERILEYGMEHYVSERPRSRLDEFLYGVMTFYLPVLLLLMSLDWLSPWMIEFTWITLFLFTLVEGILCGLALWSEAVYRENLGNPKIRGLLAKQLFSQRGGMMIVGNYRNWTPLVWLAQMMLLYSMGMSWSFWIWASIFLCKIVLEFLYANLAQELFQWLDSEWKGKVVVSLS